MGPAGLRNDRWRSNSPNCHCSYKLRNKEIVMLKQEFLVRFIMVLITKSNSWLGEEDTEAGHFKNMQDMIGIHNSEIQEAIECPKEKA